jgi:ADP-ribose pyrophosphatase
MMRNIVFRGRKIQVAVETSTTADGQAVTHDVVIHPGAVAVVPLVDADHVCLLRNHRVVVGATLLEIPAGTLEANEPPDTAAVRELAEETGYRAGRWRKLGAFYPSPGVLTERTHLYVAEELTPGPAHLEPGEEIRPEVVSWRQALAWAVDGTIVDAKTLLGLLLWDRLRSV